MNLIYQCYVDKSHKTPVQCEPISTYGSDVKDLSRLYNDMIMVSTESFKKYADHIGAEYKFDRRSEIVSKGKDRHSASVYFEWLNVIFDTSYDKYDDIAIFDLDVVANTKENIFEVSDAEVYGINESDYRIYHSSDSPMSPWDKDPKSFSLWKNKINRSGFDMIGSVAGERGALTDSTYWHFQGGMFVFSREGRIKARETFSNWEEWFYDSHGHDPNKRVNCLHYDDIYVSVNVTNNDFNYETLDPKWMDNPFHHDNPESDLGLKFMHFNGFWEKRLMCQWALDSKFYWVTDYKTNPKRLLNEIKILGFTKKGVDKSCPLAYNTYVE